MEVMRQYGHPWRCFFKLIDQKWGDVAWMSRWKLGSNGQEMGYNLYS